MVCFGNPGQLGTPVFVADETDSLLNLCCKVFLSNLWNGNSCSLIFAPMLVSGSYEVL